MLSVIIVEQELKDSVKNYGQILDGANESNVASTELSKFFTEAGAVTDKDALAKVILDHVSELSKLSDKEFEPSFNLVTYLLMELNGGSIVTVLDKYQPAFLEQLVALNPAKQPTLRDRKSIKAQSILSLLNNIFNFLPEASKYRVDVLSAILNIVEVSHLDFQIISTSIGSNLVGWLEVAGASEQVIKSQFWKFILLDQVEYSKVLLDLIKNFTNKYSITSEQELHSLIEFSLKTDIVDVSFLINKNVASAIQKYKSDSLVSLFDKYVQGELVTSTEFPSVDEKSKILALCKFFTSATTSSSVFKYSEIPTSLAANPIDLETLLIKSIKTGVIEGKLNQLTETFYLTRANRFVYAGSNENSQNWKAVEKVLQEWNNSLYNIKDIVNTTRENIVNNNQG